MATIDEVMESANLVKNASSVGENTAMRVGGVLVDILDILAAIGGGGGVVNIKVVDSPTNGLDISDEAGYVIVRLSDGHIKTKNFDSRNIDSGKGSLSYKEI